MSPTLLLPLLLAGQAAPVPIAPQDWVAVDDYPTEALQTGAQGIVRFELRVAADGSATDCKVTASSGSLMLDGRTCEIMLKRARFEPARDAEGQPISAVFARSVNWRLPEKEGPAPPSRPVPLSPIVLALYDLAQEELAGMNAALTVALAVGPDGAVTGCTIATSSGSTAADAKACALFTAQARFRSGAGDYPFRLPFFPRIKAVPVAPETWVTANDCPTAALRERKEGVVGAAIFVAADGKVTDCANARSSGDDRLDARTCGRILTRARYEPARTSAGTAVASAASHSVTWRIPN